MVQCRRIYISQRLGGACSPDEYLSFKANSLRLIALALLHCANVYAGHAI
jgi:hypothetical protein